MPTSPQDVRPEIAVLLAAASTGLPIGTELHGYETRDPDLVVLYAVQPSFQRGVEQKAAVYVSFEALRDHGVQTPIQDALALLQDRSMRRTQMGPPL